MGMSEFYGTADESEAVATIHRALDLGVTFLDTADMYGPFTNEQLVGRAITDRRDEVVLATKFGNERRRGRQLGRASTAPPSTSARPATPVCSGSGVDHIDLYYQHRVDQTVPIEETVGAMAELVTAGKVRYLGLCEAAPTPSAAAHAVAPDHGPADRVLAVHPRPRGRDPATVRELGHRAGALLPARPRLPHRCHHARSTTCRRTTSAALPALRGRRGSDANLALVEKVREIADAKGCTPGQVALAWVLAQGSDVVPIPGTKRVRLPGGERRGPA